jgi:Sulfotransferase family
MIVSDVHRYVFVELPRTGSSAVARELREQYAGRSILQKHSALRDFLAVASPEQRTYFAFTGVRNPLDDVVSDYFKYVTDHRARYSRPLPAGRWRLLALARRKLWRRVARGEMDFPAFFRSTHVLPYDTLASDDRASFDLVIRFERLAADFDEALRLIGVDSVRPLPVRNVTGGRSRDFVSYYTPEAIARAKWVFGPYMRRWGYPFPDGWGDARISRRAEVQFRLAGLLRSFYWRHVRFRLRGDRA